jgi:hypothetical protein
MTSEPDMFRQYDEAEMPTFKQKALEGEACRYGPTLPTAYVH